MKKTLLITLLFCIATICSAQSDPIKFLGIPVDGPRAQFESSLKAKGFKYDNYDGAYVGQFNGKNVNVVIHTNHDIVDRVAVVFPKTSILNLRLEYNRLLKQLNNTGKYMGFLNQEIPDGEDIDYEITLHKKDYQCVFSYFDQTRDPSELIDALMDRVLSNILTEEELASYKKHIKETMDNPDEAQDDELESMMSEFSKKLEEGSIDEEKAYAFIISFENTLRDLADGHVWFTINDSTRQIVLYYDNIHNQAHGEDL